MVVADDAIDLGFESIEVGALARACLLSLVGRESVCCFLALMLIELMVYDHAVFSALSLSLF